MTFVLFTLTQSTDRLQATRTSTDIEIKSLACHLRDFLKATYSKRINNKLFSQLYINRIRLKCEHLF